MKVISFCIYGSNEKYCRGLLENIEIIINKLPQFHIFIYVGDNVPEKWISNYREYDKVKLIYTNSIGLNNRIKRFFAIDEPDVELMIVRDADSRIHDRDVWCIYHFIHSNFKAHNIRDHPFHKMQIMAGLWGLKKGLLNKSMSELYSFYNPNNKLVNEVQHDQYFLRDIVYNLIKNNLIVYISSNDLIFERAVHHLFIPFQITDNDFCGQVIDYKNSIPYKVYDSMNSGNINTNNSSGRFSLKLT
jgi:hypothetical protein